MNIDIPRITRPLDLGGYAPEFSGVCVQVWVNPPRDFMSRWYALVEENTATGKEVEAANKSKKSKQNIAKLTARVQANGSAFIDWWAELWSQNPDTETHWTREGIITLINSDTDPKLYGWICEQSFALITEHKASAKKKLN